MICVWGGVLPPVVDKICEKTLGSINDYRYMNIKQFKNVLAVYNGLNKKVFELNFGGVFYIRDTILKVKFKSNLLVFFPINQETLTTSPDCAGSSGRTGQRISGTVLTRSGLLSARRVQYF